MSHTNEPKLKKHGVQVLQGRLIGTELQRAESIYLARTSPAQAAYDTGRRAWDRGDCRDPAVDGCPHQYRRAWLDGWDDGRDEDAEGVGGNEDDDEEAEK